MNRTVKGKKRNAKRVIWYRTFDRKSGREKFYVGDGGRSIDVRMMHVTAAFRVADLHEYDARAIQLPFGQCQREMIVILPNGDGADVAQVETAVVSDLSVNWNRLLDRLQRGLYHVALPQFDVETTSSAPRNRLPTMSYLQCRTTGALAHWNTQQNQVQ